MPMVPDSVTTAGDPLRVSHFYDTHPGLHALKWGFLHETHNVRFLYILMTALYITPGLELQDEPHNSLYS